MNQIDHAIDTANGILDEMLAREVQSLNDARGILETAARELVLGPTFPWAIVRHAEGHLDQQISELYKKHFEVSPLAVVAISEYAGDPPDDFRDDYQEPRSEFSEHMERGVRPSDFA